MCSELTASGTSTQMNSKLVISERIRSAMNSTIHGNIQDWLADFTTSMIQELEYPMKPDQAPTASNAGSCHLDLRLAPSDRCAIPFEAAEPKLDIIVEKKQLLTAYPQQSKRSCANAIFTIKRAQMILSKLTSQRCRARFPLQILPFAQTLSLLRLFLVDQFTDLGRFFLELVGFASLIRRRQLLTFLLDLGQVRKMRVESLRARCGQRRATTASCTTAAEATNAE